MDFSNANTQLWAMFIWAGVIAVLLLVAKKIKIKIKFLINSMIKYAYIDVLMMMKIISC